MNINNLFLCCQPKKTRHVVGSLIWPDRANKLKTPVWTYDFSLVASVRPDESTSAAVEDLLQNSLNNGHFPPRMMNGSGTVLLQVTCNILLGLHPDCDLSIPHSWYIYQSQIFPPNQFTDKVISFYSNVCMYFFVHKKAIQKQYLNIN